MSTEENKRLTLQFFETVGKSDNLAPLNDLAAPECVSHFPGFLTSMTRERLVASIAANRAAFPDLVPVVEDHFAEGDKVVSRTSMRLTHLGSYYGIPPSGKRMGWWTMRLQRLVDSKIVERWGFVDFVGILQQLGALPPLTQTGPVGDKVPGKAGPDNISKGETVSTDDIKALVRRMIGEVINQGEEALTSELVASTYVGHSVNHPSPGSPGPDGFVQALGLLRKPFPDLSFTIEDVIAEGTRVATRGTFRGTHQSEFMGVSPQGTQVEVAYMDIWRIENGRVVESWVQMDRLGILKQLGVSPNGGVPDN
jgi:predicted ester cyclase